MAGYITLSLGGYTIIFAVTFLLLVSIIIGILIYRQIQRLRNNSVRKPVNSTVAVELSKKGREAILKGIHSVHIFRKAHFPKFTDCTMISEHANATHVHRMIAFDEMLRDIDHQLEFIDSDLSRIPGESYYSYLKRIQSNALPELEEDFIARLAFLHEWCRFRIDMPFGVAELEEVRTHLKTFLSILNKSRQLTSTCKLPVLRSFLMAKSKSLESSRTVNLDGNKSNSKEKATKDQLDVLTERISEDMSSINTTEKMGRKYMNFKNVTSTSDINNQKVAFLPKANGKLNHNDTSESINPAKNIALNTTNPQPTITTAVDAARSSGEFGDVMSKVWTNMKKIMGFSPDCKNNGHKNLRGDCICPKYYSGDLCENMICLNGGVLHPVPYSSAVYCKCPHPDFITGKHCEMLRCHNGGHDLGNGACGCVDGWYSGRFCEYYASSWLIAVFIPLIAIALLVAYCVFCGFGSCPRRETSRRDRQRRLYQTSVVGQRSQLAALRASTRRPTPSDASLAHRCDNMAAREQMYLVQNLLNERRILSAPPRQQECVVRLEHLPIFNPRMAMVGGDSTADERFKMEPPPSYEQAVLTCPSLNAASILPPNYSPPRDAAADSLVALPARTAGQTDSRPADHSPLPRHG